MAHDVFISYSSSDKQIAHAVCAALEGSRIRCWIAPRDVLAGVPYAESLQEALTASRVLVLLLSAKSNESAHVMREVEAAVNHRVPIVPVRIQDVQPSRSLEFFLKSIHWLDAFAPPLDTHLKALVRTVREVLAREQSGAQKVLAQPAGGGKPGTMPSLPATRLPFSPWRWAMLGIGGIGILAVAGLVLSQNWGSSEQALPVKSPPEVTTVPPAKKTIDLLERVDINSDAKLGGWRWLGPGRLRGAAKKDGFFCLVLPYDPPPEYRLRFTVMRLSPRSGALIVALASGKNRFDMVFDVDRDGKVYSGLNSINDRPLTDRSDVHRGRVFPSGVAMPVVLTVQKDKLSADVNNRTVYSWQGDFVQNKLKRRRGQTEEPLQLGGVDGDFVFENVTLEPLDSSAERATVGSQPASSK